MKRAVIVLVAVLGIMLNAAYAQKPVIVTNDDPGWQKIGEITANFKLQSESIIVMGADEFTHLKLKVTDAPINIERVQVFYEGGKMEELAVASELEAGDETRVIDLSGGHVELQKVAFTYRTLPNYRGEKAHVELYGYKSREQGENYRDESEVERETEEAINEVENEVEETGRDLDRDAERTEEEIEREAEEVEEDVERAAENTEEDVERAAEDVEEGVEDGGNELSEAAAKVVAEIKDKPYVDKVGPKGETIYMDKHSKYYYINNDGKKVYITKAQMKDKPNKD